MSIGWFSTSLASSMAFSALPPTPMPIMPGGHQPLPRPAIVSTTHLTTSAPGLSVVKRALFSEPPPLAAMVSSIVRPGTSSTWTIAGVLSRVLTRENKGSATIEGRSGLVSSR